MKIDLHKLADTALRIGGPIVLAALAHKLATGKLDVKGAVLDAVNTSLPGLALDAANMAAIRASAPVS